MIDPRNPLLLRRLEETFGNVQVTNPGEPLQLVYRPDWAHRNGRLTAHVTNWGETYQVNCPFCNDTRKRLYLSHHWAVDDVDTRDDMLHLVMCHNEGCLATRKVQKELHAMVFPNGMYGRTMKVQLPPPPPASAPVAPKQIVLPTGTPLAELPEDHPAIKYLRGRKFDPARLEKRWGVYFCKANCERPGQETPPRPCFHGLRIVYPVYALPSLFDTQGSAADKGVRLVGWQARAVAAEIADGPPKYLTAAGMKKTELLYGLPQAIETEGPVVVVEGVTDAWRLRTNAVALFGKTISPPQIKLVLRHFHGRPIVVLLDVDAVDNARRVCQQIRSSRNCGGDEAPVVVAKLPTGRKDPGDCTHKEVWNAVEKAIKRNTMLKDGQGGRRGA